MGDEIRKTKLANIGLNDDRSKQNTFIRKYTDPQLEIIKKEISNTVDENTKLRANSSINYEYDIVVAQAMPLMTVNDKGVEVYEDMLSLNKEIDAMYVEYLSVFHR